MRKCLVLCLALLLAILFCGCAAQGLPQEYATEHEHVYGYWYDVAPAEGEGATQVRYCKICHAPQTRPTP